jgi:hypothetical protein
MYVKDVNFWKTSQLKLKIEINLENPFCCPITRLKMFEFLKNDVHSLGMFAN